MRRRGTGMVSDARILGNGGFVERVIAEAEAKESETLRLRQRKIPSAPQSEKLWVIEDNVLDVGLLGYIEH